MNSSKRRSKERTSIPIISYVWHRIKLAFKSKLFKKHISKKQSLKKKLEDQQKKGIDMNLFPRVSLSEPLNIIGHILLWYQIPLAIGIIISLFAGYSYQTYVDWVESQDLNIIFGMTFLVLGLTPIGLIIAIVGILRSLDAKYDVVGDEKLILNSQDVIRVAEQLAWNQAEPEVEDAKWIEDLFQKLWSHVNIFLISLVSNLFPNLLLDRILGPVNQIAELEIRKLYLGVNVPNITGIHVIKRGVKREDLIIDCEFIYDADIDIEIIGKNYINLGMKWFYLKGKTRLIVRPLFHELPVLGEVQISLLEQPKINWQFTGLLTILNWDVIKNLVQCIIAYFFLNPHKFTLKLAKEIPVKELKLREPIGLLRIEVMTAKNLPSIDSKITSCIPTCSGKPDGYCKVEVEQQSMSTQVIANDSNPEWNQEFCFLVHDSIENSIVMTVWDEDLVDDDFIGRFSIPIKSFVDNKLINGQEITVPLSKKESTHSEEKGPPPTISFRVSWFQLSTDKRKLEATANQARAQLPVAALSVLVDSATGLETCTAQVRSPELRPLVRISVGNEVHVTTIKRRTGYPVWEEPHHFILYNPKLETIHIEVIDMYNVEERQLLPFIPINVSQIGKFADNVELSNKGTVLGYYSIPTVDILNSHKMKIEGSFRLQGFVEMGHIRLLTAIRITQFESNVAENVRKPRTLLSDIIQRILIQEQLAKEIAEKNSKQTETAKQKEEIKDFDKKSFETLPFVLSEQKLNIETSNTEVNKVENNSEKPAIT